jgi:hypothetical protein
MPKRSPTTVREIGAIAEALKANWPQNAADQSGYLRATLAVADALKGLRPTLDLAEFRYLCGHGSRPASKGRDKPGYGHST